ncbi:hypothetical protein [Paenibacillus sp. OAS669]|uniref:hypothetical protein n=1 Tax=Paenibacillus sp. OAS669 TaxID=2663821 RepID=UPI00178B05EF|nr:hypothetical protein [Paenibacillus sp. OAS669]MBE1441132.1 hypothetical protein [Paenibacillus sp. OAS669]
MYEKQMVRWLGMICLLAGITRMGMTPSSLIWGSESMQELAFGLVACILMSVGTMVTYMVQAKETGITGFITVLAITVGNILTTCMLWGSMIFGNPAINPEGMLFNLTRTIALIGFTGGTIVFTVLTYRAHVFPRWISLLLVLMLMSIALPVEDNKYFAFFWGLAYVGMGYAIWAGKTNQNKHG